MTRKRSPQELLSLAGIARATGRARQTLLEQRGKLPRADYYFSAGTRKTELWKRSTLEKAGILEPAESETPMGGVQAQVTGMSGESRSDFLSHPGDNV